MVPQEIKYVIDPTGNLDLGGNGSQEPSVLVSYDKPENIKLHYRFIEEKDYKKLVVFAEKMVKKRIFSFPTVGWSLFTTLLGASIGGLFTDLWGQYDNWRFWISFILIPVLCLLLGVALIVWLLATKQSKKTEGDSLKEIIGCFSQRKEEKGSD